MTESVPGQLLQFADRQPTLAVFDENALPLPPNPFADALALSNRSDVCVAARDQGWPCDFADFVFEPARHGGRPQALYRISKEKPVVEHVLQSLWALLPLDGALCMAGFRQEGVKTFAARAQQAWTCEMQLERGRQQLHLYRFVKTGNAATALHAGDYHALRPVGTWMGREVHSKPGIFAWDRFDAGSLFLLEHLPAFLQQQDCSKATALDLGCGHGLLALALLAAGCTRVVATDNNAAALRACAFNLERHRRQQQQIAVVAGDCGDALTERFDLLLCNPPFHQGFGVEQDLTDRFLLATHRLLQPRGRALFVVNTFIPLLRKAAPLFASARTLAENRSYRLVELTP